MKSVPGRVQANQGEDIRRCAAVAVISLFIGLAAACGGDDSDYFSSVLGEAAGMQDSTNAIFGDGTNVQTCSLAAERAASNVLAVCKPYLLEMSTWSKELAAMRDRVAKLSPPSRAHDWHIRYLTFLDGVVSDAATAQAALTRKDVRALNPVVQRLDSAPARLDTLFAEMDKLR